MLVSVALCTALASFAPAKQAKPRPARKAAVQKKPAKAKAKTKAKLTPLAIQVLERVGEPVPLSKAEKAKLNQVVTALKEAGPDDPAAVPDAWAEAVSLWATRTKSQDVMAMIQWVIREAYLQQNEDLKDVADKVAYYNEMKKTVRDHVRHYRKSLAGKPKHARVSMPMLKIRPNYEPGKKAVIAKAHATKRVEEWEALMQAWEDELATVGDDAQLATINLQHALQKQQQLMQMISNISKILHDTAMAVIRNMR